MIPYNTNRAGIERLGRTGAKVLEETDNTMLVRVLNTFDLFVLKDDVSITPHLEKEGFWEPWITSWLTHWLRPGQTFIDVGANSGYYTHLACELVGRHGTVVAYEPNPIYAELLRHSRNTNRYSFKIREVALCAKVGTANLTVPANYHGSASIMSSFEEFELTQVYDVRTSTLNAEVQNLTFFRHDIVKIDAESAEEKIWEGGKNLWDSVDHSTILLEYTPDSYSKTFLNDLYEWGNVTAINFDGGEVPVSKHWIEQLTDWHMLVVRKR